MLSYTSLSGKEAFFFFFFPFSFNQQEKNITVVRSTFSSGSIILWRSHIWTHNGSALETEFLKETVNSASFPDPLEAGGGGHSTHPSVVTTSEGSFDTNAVVDLFFPTQIHNVSFSGCSGISQTLNHNDIFLLFGFIHSFLQD